MEAAGKEEGTETEGKRGQRDRGALWEGAYRKVWNNPAEQDNAHTSHLVTCQPKRRESLAC